MTITYLCTSMYEARKGDLVPPYGCEDWDEYFDEWGGDEWTFGIWEYETGGKSRFVAADGGEPEDNSFVRDGAWIAPALNSAYSRGWSDALATFGYPIT